MYSSKAIITGLITIMFISQSCSSLERVSNPYYLANRNITAINRQLKKYKERGNVFCFSSTASSDVIVWHYSPESVEYVLYRKGRIMDIQQYKSNGLSAIKTFANSWEIPNYSYVLDGDMLYMCIDDFSIEESLLVDILDKTSLPHNKLVLFIVSDLLQYYSLIHEL